MSVTVRIDTKVLERMQERLGMNTDRALASIAGQVTARAKTLAPVDTGNLKDSIIFERERQGLYIVSDGMEYGVYQELGTSKMAAQPFMVPAVEETADEVARKFGEVLE